jgi:uncharacterized protein involved in response to NO
MFDQHPLWRLAFRPLYLLAAAFAAIAVPLWLASYSGVLPALPRVGLDWHMHEMVFGFAVAVVVGFLFTAGRNWTGLWTPRRGPLAAFCALWLAGRIAMLWAPPLPAAVIDVLFLPCAAWAFFRVLKASGNYRNMFSVALLLLLALLNLLFHAAGMSYVALSQVMLMQAAILTVVVIVTIIGGRVIPLFTKNAAGSAPRVNRKLDWTALALLVLASLCWLGGAWPWLTSAAAALAGCAQLYRLLGWQPQSTVRHPLLWILHLSYGWIGFGLLLLALAAVGTGAASAAFHALAVGAIGGMIIGMITRTTLGHTARPLQAGRSETLMFLLIQASAAARFFASIVNDDYRQFTLLISALCWSSGFIVYLWVYAPYLLRARLDGREG